MLNLRIKAIELRNKLFGPPHTEEEMVLLRTRADVEDWTGFLDKILELPQKRRRRWWIRHLIDGDIIIYNRAAEEEDPYEDDDPWEQEL